MIKITKCSTYFSFIHG